jgi:hypothetical protein
MSALKPLLLAGAKSSQNLLIQPDRKMPGGPHSHAMPQGLLLRLGQTVLLSNDAEKTGSVVADVREVVSASTVIYRLSSSRRYDDSP